MIQQDFISVGVSSLVVTLGLVLTLGLQVPVHAESSAPVTDKDAQANQATRPPIQMSRYTQKIPGTEITFEMIPVQGGTFVMGSPENEEGHQTDEGPQLLVRVQPFWMGKCEVTWQEYRAFMNLYYAFKSLDTQRSNLAHAGELTGKAKSLKALQQFLTQESIEVDGVTCPTPLYDPDTTYMAGEEPNKPAVTMTQFAAKQYTKWLSGITDKQYRLPTEAEWEYAARAGTRTSFSCGEGDALEDHAWYADNSDELTHAVGTKMPNPWGFYDMHGNAAEWVLDEYSEQHYQELRSHDEPKRKGKTKLLGGSNTIRWPTRLYPRVIRGGSYFDAPIQLRSAARHKSADPEWNLSDPNLPKSPWWFTEYESTGVGFRILRPWKSMDETERKKVWDADIERIREDVADRLDEGRGARSAADVRLPVAILELEEAKMIE